MRTCVHPPYRMLYDTDFACCRECEQKWLLITRENNKGEKYVLWLPDPPIEDPTRFRRYSKKPARKGA